MAFADKSWADPTTYSRTVLSWKRYGTSFLLFAVLLNALGAVISPLQEIFLSSKIVKTPLIEGQYGTRILDLKFDIFNGINEQRASGRENHSDNIEVLFARSALTTASLDAPQVQLWQENVTSCSSATSDTCGRGNTFGNMTEYINPFLAELPNSYNTGLIRQFAPRINSSVSYKSIDSSEYPQNCKQLPGSFFTSYSIIDVFAYTDKPTYVNPQWFLEACMPSNMTQSPWKGTRDRQDFNETLYLNITAGISSGIYRIEVNTTAGYFELPNYMNGGLVGPLLSHDPKSICGKDCAPEGDDI